MGKYLLLLALLLLFPLFCGKYVLKNRNNWKSGLALILWSVLLVLMFLETYYRFFYIKSDALGLLDTNFSNKYYREDKWGFRDSLLPLSQEKSNIIILGDSFVFGHGLKSPEARYSNLLRKRLRDYHIVNLSENGASTKDEIKFLLRHHWVKTKTKFIILNYVFNDIQDCIPSEQVKYRIKQPKILRKIFKYSELFKHVYFNVILPVERLADGYNEMLSNAYRDEEVLDTHIGIIKILKYITEETYQARLVVVVWPWSMGDFSYSPEYKAMTAAFTALEVPVIDLVAPLNDYNSDEMIVSRQDPHPNEKANLLVSALVYEYLAGQLKRPKTASLMHNN